MGATSDEGTPQAESRRWIATSDRPTNPAATEIYDVTIRWQPTLLNETKVAGVTLYHWDSRMKTERETFEAPPDLVLEWASFVVRGASPNKMIICTTHGSSLTSKQKMYEAFQQCARDIENAKAVSSLWIIDEIDKVSPDAKSVLDELRNTGYVSYEALERGFLFTKTVVKKAGPFFVFTLVTTGRIGPAERTFPANVQREVWERDGGRCRSCGSTQDLQFDHILPFSKGGSSSTIENCQLLCGRCNRAKLAKIGG